MDNDTLILRDIHAVVSIIDVEFKLADINGKRKLRTPRKKAFRDFRKARKKLLMDRVICTPADVKKMKEIREEVEKAADVQKLISRIGQLVNFLRGLIFV